MSVIQSFGAGVNSVALSLILPDSVERVFADTGAEQPETYEYLKQHNFHLTVLDSPVEGCNNIIDWCHKLGHGPFRMRRSCTDKFKRRRIEKYIKRPAIIYIGFSAEEAHRAKTTDGEAFKRQGIEYRYPLIEQGITREGCKKLIRDAGLPVPPKSGCYICPFQPKGSWWRLARQHPDLFWKAVEIDELSKKIGLWRDPGDLRHLWPPQMVFEEDEGWECGIGCLLRL